MAIADPPLTSAALHDAVARLLGPGTAVVDLGTLAGGASRLLHRVDATTTDGETHRLVVSERPDDAGRGAPERSEIRAMEAAYAAGVPLPRPYGLIELDGGRPPLLVMAFAEGEALPRRILRDARYERARRRLAGDVGRATAKIHTIRAADLGLAVPDEPATAAAIAEVERFVDATEAAHPVLELGLRILRRTAPIERRERVLVHGDLRLGNMLVGEQGLVAVLDWELVHIGDPAADLGWMCSRAWRFGVDDRPALGVASREALLEAYRAGGGADVTLDELRWWEALANARWAAICALQANRHLSGAQPSLELATIGRRTCEAEWDLLELIG